MDIKPYYIIVKTDWSTGLPQQLCICYSWCQRDALSAFVADTHRGVNVKVTSVSC